MEKSTAAIVLAMCADSAGGASTEAIAFACAKKAQVEHVSLLITQYSFYRTKQPLIVNPKLIFTISRPKRANPFVVAGLA